MVNRSNDYRFFLEIRRRDERGLLAREPVDDAFLEPVRDDALWQARRRGIAIHGNSSPACTLEPLFSGDRDRRVRALDLRVAAGGRELRREYPLEIFRAPGRALLLRLLEEGRLRSEDEVETSVLALDAPPVREPGAPGPAGLPAGITVEEEALLLRPGDLQEWISRSTPLNPEARDRGDTPVFIHGKAFEEARRFCRLPGTREGGAILVGRLFRQEEPEPEIFAVIEAAFEARHAEREQFRLELTAETYRYFDLQLARRRRRLGRPEEIILGSAHGHNFAPSLDERGRANCPSCPKRPICPLHSAFFSGADERFHRALFARRPFAVGLVWGLDPREGDVVRAYGFRDGVIAERSIWIAAGGGGDRPTCASRSDPERENQTATS